MRVVTSLSVCAALGLSGCDDRIDTAKEIVRDRLGRPAHVEFRRLRAKGDDQIVCGEVDAIDRPGSGWRYFVAYIDLKQAVVAPPGGISADAEIGNPLLAGEAARFNKTCD